MWLSAEGVGVGREKQKVRCQGTVDKATKSVFLPDSNGGGEWKPLSTACDLGWEVSTTPQCIISHLFPSIHYLSSHYNHLSLWHLAYKSLHINLAYMENSFTHKWRSYLNKMSRPRMFSIASTTITDMGFSIASSVTIVLNYIYFYPMETLF